MTFGLIAAAHATTVTRSFISNTGSDSNTSVGCIVTSPCKTFAMALTVTISGGEIVVMNPGGYGPLTITGPLTIVGTDGASVTATTGTVGFTITAGATDKVVIRDIEMTGANATNSIGIKLNSGNLTLINTKLKLMTTALVVGDNSATAHADVINSDIVGNGTGIMTNGAGVNTSVGSPPYTGTQTLVRLSGGNIIDNTTALAMQNAAGDSSQNCENTFYAFTSNGEPTINIAGFTTFISATPSGPPYNCGLQTYYSNPSSGAPN